MCLIKQRILVHFFINICIIITSFIKTKQSFDEYISSLKLINEEYSIVAKDGIHFYDKSLIENIEKKVKLNLELFNEDIGQVKMIQFSYEHGGYILIVINESLYLFNKSGNKLISLENEYLHKIKTFNYSLIPNKKQNNYLSFVIVYIESNSIIINNCNFNLITKELKIYKNNYFLNNSINSKDINCIIMSRPLSSLNLTNDVLACFYHSNGVISSAFFDIETKINEISSLRYTTKIPIIQSNSLYINSIANKNKQKALIYLFTENKLFWLTFDFINKFSDIKSETFDEFFISRYYMHQLLYIKETKEFVIFASFVNYNKLILIFNDELIVKHKDIIYYNNTKYNNGTFFTISYDGNNYQIINNKAYKKSFKKFEFNIKDNKRHLEDNVSVDIKCQTYSEESASHNLCTSCKTAQNYYPADFNTNDDISTGFIECYNDETKPSNSYFDSTDQKYKLCYESCQTCETGGDWENNNCLTCASNYIKKPGFPDTKNCVIECFYSYYYTPYGYYKCSNTSNCPDNANLYIRELKKCTDDCNKEETFKYQYGGQCWSSCPANTQENENNICLDVNVDTCSKSENQIDLQQSSINEVVDLNAKNYAKEFSYTQKHVSLFYNSIYSIVIYRDINCINQLSINMPKVDFGKCYTKLKNTLNITETLIIALIQKKNGKGEKKSTSYFFYHPTSGNRLLSEEICKDEEVVVKESIMAQLNENEGNINLDSVMSLTKQNIDIFNLSNEFYTDICYHFESPDGKDVPFGERIHIYYPNITLCELGCVSQGINFATMESICQCQMNDIMNNDLVSGNALVENTLSEVFDILSSSNLLVLTCYKDVFKPEFIIKSKGGFIVIGIFLLQFIFILIFLINNKNDIEQFFNNLTQYYIIFRKTEREKEKENNIKSANKNGIIINKSNKITLLKSKVKSSPPGKKKAKNEVEREPIAFKKKNNKNKIFLIPKNESSKNATKYDLIKNSKNNLIGSEKEKTTKKNHELISAKKKCGNIDIEEYLKPDIDDMEYDDAVKLDKRSFCEYLSDTLKEKQIIMETFFYKENIKPKSVKIVLLFLEICLYFVVNGLFFNEDYIIKLYKSEDDNFFSYITRSYGNFFYSLMVGIIVDTILDCIFIDEKVIKRVFLREKDNPLQLKYEIKVNTKSIIKRYIIFFIICVFIELISWYYVSCFNCVYPGTQLEWIKSSVTIIFIMQIISVLMRILESIIRSISFKCKSEKIYKVKQLLP